MSWHAPTSRANALVPNLAVEPMQMCRQCCYKDIDEAYTHIYIYAYITHEPYMMTIAHYIKYIYIYMMVLSNMYCVCYCSRNSAIHYIFSKQCSGACAQRISLSPPFPLPFSPYIYTLLYMSRMYICIYIYIYIFSNQLKATPMSP